MIDSDSVIFSLSDLFALLKCDLNEIDLLLGLDQPSLYLVKLTIGLIDTDPKFFHLFFSVNQVLVVLLAAIEGRFEDQDERDDDHDAVDDPASNETTKGVTIQGVILVEVVVTEFLRLHIKLPLVSLRETQEKQGCC